MRACIVFIAVMSSVSLMTSCTGGVKTPRTVAVSGKVIYQAKPLEGATISFMTKGASRAATGVTNAKGEFIVSTFGKNDGAVPGEHCVTIRCFQSPEFQKKTHVDSSAYEKARQEAAAAGQSTNPISLIPLRYTLADKSGLIAVVEVGKQNMFEFELTE